jgi:hypothetical protein
MSNFVAGFFTALAVVIFGGIVFMVVDSWLWQRRMRELPRNYVPEDTQ